MDVVKELHLSIVFTPASLRALADLMEAEMAARKPSEEARPVKWFYGNEVRVAIVPDWVEYSRHKHGKENHWK